MKKLALRLDDLRVESFDLLPDAGAPARTVAGYRAVQTDEECAIQSGVKNPPSCGGSCLKTCGHSCQGTCGLTCPDPCTLPGC